jgi:hypothetical protein
MSNFWETDKFKKLNAKWQKKLKDSGFDDAETKDHKLKRYSQLRAEQARKETVGREEYYYMARMFLNDFEFDSERNRQIWSGHSDGLTVLEIAEGLRKNKKNKEQEVKTVIKQLKAKMKAMYIK